MILFEEEIYMYDQPPEQRPYRSSPPDYTQYPQGYPQYSDPSPYDPREPQYAPPPYIPPQQQYYAPQPQVQVYYTTTPTVEEPGSTSALLGFIFSLVGVFAFPVMLIPGLILSIYGLKSRSRHGLALAGLIISIVVTILWVLLIAFIVIAAIAAASTAPSYPGP